MYSLAQDDGAYPHTRLELRRLNSGCDAAAFDFGCARGWEQFAVFIANNDGSILTVSPVSPPGAVLRRDEIEQLMVHLDSTVAEFQEYADDAERAKVWLESVFLQAEEGQPAEDAPGDIFQCCHPATGDGVFCRDPLDQQCFLVPAIQGPLPIYPMPPVHGTAEGQEVVDLRVFPAAACALPALHMVHAHGQVQGAVCTVQPIPVWDSVEELKHGRVAPTHVPFRGAARGSVSASSDPSKTQCVLGLCLSTATPDQIAEANAANIVQLPRLLLDPHSPHISYVVRADGITAVQHLWLETVSAALQGRHTARAGNKKHLSTYLKVASQDSGVPGAAILPSRLLGYQMLVLPGQALLQLDRSESDARDVVKVPTLMMPLSCVYFTQLQRQAELEASVLGSTAETKGGPSAQPSVLLSRAPLQKAVKTFGDMDIFAMCDPNRAPDLVRLNLNPLSKLAETAQRLDAQAIRPLLNLQAFCRQRLVTLVQEADSGTRQHAKYASDVQDLRIKYEGHLETVQSMISRTQRQRAKLTLILRALGQRFSRLSRAELTFVQELKHLQVTLRSEVEPAERTMQRVLQDTEAGQYVPPSRVYGMADLASPSQDMRRSTSPIVASSVPSERGPYSTPSRGGAAHGQAHTPSTAGRSVRRPPSIVYSPAVRRPRSAMDSADTMDAAGEQSGLTQEEINEVEAQVAKLQSAVLQRKTELLQAVRTMDELVAHAASVELEQHARQAGQDRSPGDFPAHEGSSPAPPRAAQPQHTPAGLGHVAFMTPGKPPHVAATPMSASAPSAQTPARVAPSAGYHTPAGAMPSAAPTSSRRKGRSTAKKRFGLMATNA